MTPHVIGCKCEGCLEGRYEQHPAGCQCSGCLERDGGMFGHRVQKAMDAASAVKQAFAKVANVLTPGERRAILRIVKGDR